MGVSIYLLDRRRVTLLIDGVSAEIGTHRRSWKVTELDGERASELETAKAGLKEAAAPKAVMVVDVIELPLAGASGISVPAHLVLGWDADRSSVTDYRWDHLPLLGYAVRAQKAGSTDYVLHEEKAERLHPIKQSRAVEVGLLDRAGSLVRLGQPRIATCRSVQPYVSIFARADCVLSDGTNIES